jgi:hypothetical protein
MKRVGDILVGARAITPEVRDRILANRGRFPVRFGTAVLEAGVVPEEVLLRALSVQSGAPSASARDLAEIPPDILRLVPHKLAARHGVIPFRRIGRSIHLAMRDPKDLPAVDEISFLTGATVVPHVALEVRVAMALERHYNIAAEAQYRNLAARLDGRPVPAEAVMAAVPLSEPVYDEARLEQPLPEPPAPSTAYSPQPEAAPLRRQEPPPPPRFTSRPEPPAPAPLEGEDPWRSQGDGPTGIEDLLARAPEIVVEVFAAEAAPVRGEAVRSVATAVSSRPAAPSFAEAAPGPAPARPSLAPPRPPLAPAASSVFAARLAAADSREEIADAVLDATLLLAERAALFIVQADRTIGWAARPEPPAGFRSFSIPFLEPTLFTTLRNTDGYYAGPVPEIPGNRKILEAVGAGAAKSLVLVPVLLKQKTVLFLLGTSPSGSPLPPVVELRRLAAMTATALEIVLLRHRLLTL